MGAKMARSLLPARPPYSRYKGGTLGYSRYKGSSSLIDDGIPDWGNLPPWCEGNEKIVEINKKLKAQREAIKTAG